MRKHNYIEAYYDEHGTLGGKSRSRLFPQANYQAKLYANFENANEEHLIGASFYLDDGTQKPELPMSYAGSFRRDGKDYERWELYIPEDITSYFKTDRETKMSIKFLEYEPYNFIGFYDAYGDMPTGDDGPEHKSLAYLLEDDGDNEQGMYTYEHDDPDDEDNTDGEWVYTEEPEDYENVVWGSALFDVSVARSFRVEKEKVDVEIEDILMQAIAKLQGSVFYKDGREKATDNWDIDDHVLYNIKEIAEKNSDGDVTEQIIFDTAIRFLKSLDMEDHDISNIKSINGRDVSEVFDDLDDAFFSDGSRKATGDWDLNGYSLESVDTIHLDEIILDGISVKEELDSKVDQDDYDTKMDEVDSDLEELENALSLEKKDGELA